ncbi:MAG: hypothetical protein A2516_10995 [Alphaproteobacteria bacterium RIFOXYD12_FULL_60_8]|nr:MAG: hypothetical protein A2516_10995 [Alphaproteobacteria bacterium RIFOXYD12_FULL_60_8]
MKKRSIDTPIPMALFGAVVMVMALMISPAMAANPCAGAEQPGVDPSLVTRPEGTELAKGDPAAQIKLGESLFKDTSLSSNGFSCDTCHAENASFNASFAQPYPHEVAMAVERGGITSVDLDEMVQFCLVVPMETKPLPWDSKELSALTAYTAQLQKAFQKAAHP